MTTICLIVVDRAGNRIKNEPITNAAHAINLLRRYTSTYLCYLKASSGYTFQETNAVALRRDLKQNKEMFDALFAVGDRP